jgi:peptidoglycan/xylan/chitin deacetylase (PgdA/CDA1 family)
LNLLVTFVFSLALCPASTCRAKGLALTFDDGLDPLNQPMALEWNSAILNTLSKAKIKSMFFPRGERIDSPGGLKLVRDWGESGHAIGNHTYSHLNFCSKQVTLERFINDTVKNQALLENMPGWTRRLRFPFLKEGESPAKRDCFRKWLKAHGYKSGAVSIDTSDWYYNNRYLAWRKAHTGEDLAPFRTAYLNHLWNRTIYYDSLSQRVLNRSVKHILLLHVNPINAAFLPDILKMYRSKGWQIISPQEAFKDPVYSMTPKTLPAGESILWALAKQHGVKGLRYPAEDGKYEKPLLLKSGLVDAAE